MTVLYVTPNVISVSLIEKLIVRTGNEKYFVNRKYLSAIEDVMVFCRQHPLAFLKLLQERCDSLEDYFPVYIPELACADEETLNNKTYLSRIIYRYTGVYSVTRFKWYFSVEGMNEEYIHDKQQEWFVANEEILLKYVGMVWVIIPDAAKFVKDVDPDSVDYFLGDRWFVTLSQVIPGYYFTLN